MYDHPIFVGVQYHLNKFAGIDQLQAMLNPFSYTDYFLFGKGIWTSIGKTSINMTFNIIDKNLLEFDN